MTGSRDIFAVIGALYVARKLYAVVSSVVEAINVHVLGQRRVMWVEKYGPWAGRFCGFF